MIIVWSRRRKAFTLIETVLTLFVVSGLLLFTTTQINLYRQQTEERLFFQNFESNWHNLLNMSYLQQESFTLVLKEDRMTIITPSKYLFTRFPRSIKAAPKSIRIDHELPIKPASINFYSHNKKLLRHYTIQMNWGVLFVK